MNKNIFVKLKEDRITDAKAPVAERKRGGRKKKRDAG